MFDISLFIKLQNYIILSKFIYITLHGTIITNAGIIDFIQCLDTLIT